MSARAGAVDPDVFRHNATAERNRRRKAVLLAVALRAADLDVPPDGPRERGRLCRSVGVPRASEETWRLAVRAAAWQDRMAERYGDVSPPWWSG